MAAEPRRGLGRGLSALLGEEGASAAPGSQGARELPIELVGRNPDQPRFDFNEAELEELAASMRERGVLQPILVRPAPSEPGRYQIVAGERRWRAAQKAGLSVIPAVVRDLDDRQTLEAALIENVQRADLNAIEEAVAYRTLMEIGERTQEDVSETVGKSRSHVANALRLLHLPPEVQALVLARKLSAGHARAIIGAPDVEALARRIVEEGLNVREAEALARGEAGSSRKSSSSAKAPRGKSADTLELQRNLSDLLGLKVELDDQDGKGEIRIRYQSLEQLEDVCRRLMRPS